jgi:two-component system sensor kinase FixL
MTPPADAWPGPGAIIAHAREAIIGETLDGVIASWNPAAEALFGLSAQKAIGQSMSLLRPEASAADGPDAADRPHGHGTQFRGHDGVLFAASVTTSPILDAEGALAGHSYFIRPITAGHGAPEREVLSDRLAHLSRLGAMGQLAPMLAHELKQPLTAIVTYMTAAQRLLRPNGSKQTEMLTDVLEEALGQARRADQIIKHLRSFVSDDRSVRQPTEITELLSEVGDLIDIAARQAGVTVHAAPTVSSAVLVNRVQIQQVLFNLMRNAIEAMDTTSVRELRLAVEEVGDKVQVSIADTGPGLPEAVAARLFDPFFTTKPDGMGLGLSICRSIVEQHGGELWFESAEGGAVVHFTLPLGSGSESGFA